MTAPVACEWQQQAVPDDVAARLARLLLGCAENSGEQDSQEQGISVLSGLRGAAPQQQGRPASGAERRLAARKRATTASGRRELPCTVHHQPCQCGNATSAG